VYEMSPSYGAAVALLLVLALGACLENGRGFIQLKTVPASSFSQPPLYLDSAKLELLKRGEAVLARNAGTAKLQTDGPGGLALLCEVVVKKNRITTVTISIAERPPRCQCRTSGAPASTRVCVS
jgi:hypothetical protein